MFQKGDLKRPPEELLNDIIETVIKVQNEQLTSDEKRQYDSVCAKHGYDVLQLLFFSGAIKIVKDAEEGQVKL